MKHSFSSYPSYWIRVAQRCNNVTPMREEPKLLLRDGSGALLRQRTKNARHAKAISVPLLSKITRCGRSVSALRMVMKFDSIFNPTRAQVLIATKPFQCYYCFHKQIFKVKLFSTKSGTFPSSVLDLFLVHLTTLHQWTMSVTNDLKKSQNVLDFQPKARWNRGSHHFVL